MDKRYQIFVSSTFADLKTERQAVMEALLSLDHFPAGMELFPASNDDQWALIKGVIDDSDYYTVVIAGRYGSTTDEGISYTEREFDYAVAKGIPILAFLHEHPELIPSGKTDEDDKRRKHLEAFRKKIESSRHVKYWNNPDDLKAKVIQSISAETKRNPREGWVRSSRATDPVLLETLRQENDRLRGEVEALSTQAPRGSEAYASGGEFFGVSVNYTTGDTWPFTPGIKQIEMSWDNILYELGPSLMEEATEGQMKRRLSNEIRQYDWENKLPRDAKNIAVADDDFDTIKVQLRVLGLIQRSTKKHTPSYTNRYWALTPYGEARLLSLRAIAKGKRAPAIVSPESGVETEPSE